MGRRLVILKLLRSKGIGNIQELGRGYEMGLLRSHAGSRGIERSVVLLVTSYSTAD